MRNYFPETTIGFLQIPIELVPLDINCQDELNFILKGLQEIYKNRVLCLDILDLIKKDISPNPDKTKGTKGLSFWEIFVLAIVRRSGYTDYRKLAYLASNHISLIGILGHGSIEGQLYSHSTLQDNIVLIQEKTLDTINVMVVKHAQIYCKNPFEKVRADSFVFESNIHFHADYKSLVDGARCLLREGERLANLIGFKGFRQRQYLTNKIKNLGYKIVQINKSTKAKAIKDEELFKGYVEILDAMEPIYEKIFSLLEAAIQFDTKTLSNSGKIRFEKLLNKIYFFFSGTAIEHELAKRRVILGETIGAKEKIFSLFEPHAEMICKGKVKVRMEFGHAVIVAQCNNGFMLTGDRIDSGLKDADICIPFIKELQEKYDNKIKCITFDKGFYNPKNKKEIKELLPESLLLAKGKTPIEEKTSAYYEKKHWHSGVESSINALEQGNNMGVCLDKGKPGFDRCVKASILARNLQRLGLILFERSRQKLAA